MAQPAGDGLDHHLGLIRLNALRLLGGNGGSPGDSHADEQTGI
jgi:hypothetical protein